MTNPRQGFGACQMHYNCAKENSYVVCAADEKGGEGSVIV
jgi:hypothetical protein